MILSRLNDPVTRTDLELGEGWRVVSRIKREEDAVAELYLLSAYAQHSEYKLAAKFPAKKRIVYVESDDLDDCIPF